MAGEQDFRLQPGALNVIAKELRPHSPCGGPWQAGTKKSIWVAGQPNQFLMNLNLGSSHSPISFELYPVLLKDAPFGRR
jgi:hypothetical protein